MVPGKLFDVLRRGSPGIVVLGFSIGSLAHECGLRVVERGQRAGERLLVSRHNDRHLFSLFLVLFFNPCFIQFLVQCLLSFVQLAQ